MVADAVSNEKGVDRNIIFEAIELALATAAKKRFDEDSTITVTIDRRTGGYVTERSWKVVGDDTLAALGTEFTLQEAHEKDPSLKPGDVYSETIENVEFGRITAQTAKQVIVQKVRKLSVHRLLMNTEAKSASWFPAWSKSDSRQYYLWTWVITPKAFCLATNWWAENFPHE